VLADLVSCVLHIKAVVRLPLRQLVFLVWYTNTTLSAGCPTSVEITITPDVMPYRPGHVLSCSADGYDPTYTWTGDNPGDIDSLTGSTYTLVEGEFDLTCTATIEELMCTVTATGTVTGTALGK